ncbi:MAG TPA: hypothetical protein VIJ82_03640 [Streptosporangiaceae bacterium]
MSKAVPGMHGGQACPGSHSHGEREPVFRPVGAVQPADERDPLGRPQGRVGDAGRNEDRNQPAGPASGREDEDACERGIGGGGPRA